MNLPSAAHVMHSSQSCSRVLREPTPETHPLPENEFLVRKQRTQHHDNHDDGSDSCNQFSARPARAVIVSKSGTRWLGQSGMDDGGGEDRD